jgi:hypothetical protein
LTKWIGSQTPPLRDGSTVTGGGAVAVAQARGTDNVPIDMPRRKPNTVPSARPTFGIRARSAAALSNSAALLSEFSWLIATSIGADSELSFDSDAVTGQRETSKLVSGDTESASSASGMVDIS